MADTPPRIPRWLIRVLLSREVAEIILGDLDEEFRIHVVTRLGGRKARRWYWRHALASLVARRPRAAPIGSGWFSAIGGDLRVAVRTAARTPGFTVIAAGTLALGIGATTTVFSVVHATLLRPLPYASPDALALIWQRFATAPEARRPVPAVDILDLNRTTTLFQGFAAINRPIGATLQSGDVPQHITISRVSVNVFDLLGVEPVIGRTFNEQDLLIGGGGAASVLLSHHVWQRVYGGDSTIMNRRVLISGEPATVIGILPSGFRLVLPPDVGMPGLIDAWVPMRLDGERGIRETQRLRDQDSDDTGAVVARLRPGTSLAAARTELDAAAQRLQDNVPFYRQAGVRFEAFPMQADAMTQARPILTALMGAVGLVLLVACVNIANLMLGRLAYRRREISLRVALGATRTRVMTQLIVEAAVIGAAGGGLGIALALYAVELFAAHRPSWLPAGHPIAIDPAVAAAAVGLTGLAVVLFGLAPAMRAVPPGGLSLRGGTERRQRTRSLLVATEIALSMALLAGTGLLLRTAIRLAAVDPGFDAAGVLTFDITLRDRERYRGPGDRGRFVRGLESQLRAIPGVTHASVVGALPLSGRSWATEYGRDGQAIEQWASNEANVRMISEEFFDVMGVQLLAGRSFVPEDDRQDRRVAIIDAVMAERLGLGLNAVGHRLGFPVDGERVWGEIVGIVETIRYESLTGNAKEAIYVPYRHEASRDVSFVVRATGVRPLGLAGEVRRAVQILDPNLPVHGLRPLADYVGDALAPTRFTLAVLAGFALTTLSLAGIGLYGVVSFTVARRLPEIGIRLALGAGPGSVVRLVVRQGMMVAGAGMVAGAAVALLLSTALRNLLFDTSPVDPMTLAGVGLLLGAVTLLACYLPARRASRVDPVSTLRSE